MNVSKAGQKLIYKEKLKLDDNDSTRLSYDVVFRQPELKRQKEEEKEKVSDEQMQEALREKDRQWEQRLQQARQQAVQEGYETGLQEGKAEARAEIQDHLQHFRESIQQVDNHVQEIIQELKPGITSLIFDIAEKVIGVPVHSDELQQRVEREMARVLDQVDEDLNVKIHVSNEDYQTIRELVDQIGRRNVNIQRDESLNPGEYAVETNREAIVQNFQKNLMDMREDLKHEDWGNGESEEEESS